MPGYFILISTSGFPEIENFNALQATVEAQAYNLGSKLAASLFVPGSIGLQMEISLLEPHLELICQAGAQFGKNLKISEELIGRINTPILSAKKFNVYYSRYEAWCRKKLSNSGN